MNLILQAIELNAATAQRLATLAQPALIRALGPNTFIAEQVSDTPSIRSAVDAACATAAVDAAWLAAPFALNDFGLLAMDMDSTLITIECIDEIADMQGLKPQVAAITAAAMRGDLDFSASLTQRVSLLAGLEVGALQQVFDQRLRLSPGAERLLQAVRDAGLKTLLVSGGFTFFTERLQQQLGLDFTQANQLEIVAGKLTGKVLGTLVDAAEKQRIVARTCAALSITPAQAIVIGDGANDLQMMRDAGLSVAYRAKPVVRSQARVALNHVGLDGVLALFG